MADDGGFVKALLAAVISRQARLKGQAADQLVGDYMERSGRYLSCEERSFANEAEFLAAVERGPGRTAATVVLLDSRGRLLSSEEFAEYLRGVRDGGTQRLVLAVGPADGWSAVARQRADLLLSFGKMTMSHGLARVVAAEQLYRALTILAGHPYHTGH